MSSRHLIDPQLLDLLGDTFKPLNITVDNLPAIRAAWNEQEAAKPDVGADTVDCSVIAVQPLAGPPVELRIFRPKRLVGAVGGIFHIHGGGYIGGDAAYIGYALRPLSDKLDCVIATVNYRLAPETCYPGNIEDCYAALSWLFKHAREVDVDAQRIGVMGESAGGGLAAALALLARDRGEYRLAFQHLIYPMLDDRTCVLKDPHPFTGEFGWTADNNHFGWSALLGKPPGSSGVSPYAAAARAVELEGLPPTFISTAALDLFLEENIEYARRLLRAGVPTELHVYPGAFHGFDFHPTAKVAVQAQRDSLAALGRFLDKSV